MGYVLLFAAIISEVIGSSMLKLSTLEGIPKFWGNVGVVAGFMVALYFLQHTLHYLPLNTAYAIWSGIGTALTVGVGVYFFKESINGTMIIGIVFIIVGVIVLNVGKVAH
ncbi:DMT family transporter [Pontibacillus litoralis]|uniref:Quaternary ammonium transporter n=1 Tax=Pontibacillus litoralis JSM 072002 TaxID=1385512 RepID=A0A0A5G5I5_9BACI|nr:multidrug efflux SMR transporter [Pontibacillus litoralis]KGX87324.1 quaternary ammonium transporter [Pontibacillus litoralis JSM 072002]